MKNVLMIDIETTGTKPGCKVLSLGAFGFGEHCQQCQYYEKFSAIAQTEAGFKDEESTMEWWKKQPEDVMLEAFSNPMEPAAAIEKFEKFLSENFDPSAKNFEVWSCGIDFDFPILRHLFEHYGHEFKWKFWQQRDYRTIKSLFKVCKKSEGNVEKHNSLEDAKAQMRGLRAFHIQENELRCHG